MRGTHSKTFSPIGLFVVEKHREKSKFWTESRAKTEGRMFDSLSRDQEISDEHAIVTVDR